MRQGSSPKITEENNGRPVSDLHTWPIFSANSPFPSPALVTQRQKSPGLAHRTHPAYKLLRSSSLSEHPLHHFHLPIPPDLSFVSSHLTLPSAVQHPETFLAMHRAALRPAARAFCRNAASPASRRLASTSPVDRPRSWKSSALRWGLAGGALYYYSTSNVFAEEPQR